MARPRSNSFASQLPPFEVEPSKDFPEWLKVYCPRNDCPSWVGRGKSKHQKPFLVHEKTWLKPLISPLSNLAIVGRPCPYCLKSGKIPAKSG